MMWNVYTNSFIYTNKFVLNISKISALILKDNNILVYRDNVENPIILKNEKIKIKGKDILLYDYLTKLITESEEA